MQLEYHSEESEGSPVKGSSSWPNFISSKQSVQALSHFAHS